MIEANSPSKQQVIDYLDHPPQRYAHTSGSLVEAASGSWVKFVDMDLFMFEGGQLMLRMAAEHERLTAVAVAAKRLVQTAHDYIDHDETTVEEPALTALESALEAAGYDMADGEFCGRLAAAPESRDG